MAAYIDGVAVELTEAIGAAAGRLAAARMPLVTGLCADMATIRAAHALAQRCGAVIDHAQSAAFFPIIEAVREGGLVMGLPAEVRRRADRLLLVGADALSAWPGLLDIVLVREPDLGPGAGQPRAIAWIGPPANASDWPAGIAITPYACPQERLTEVLGLLACALAGRPHREGPFPKAQMAALVEFLEGAGFGCIAWSVRATDTLGHRMAAELVDRLNLHTRYTAMPIHADPTGYGAAMLSTFVTGFPLRVRASGSGWAHDPILYDASRLLAAGECDAALSVHTQPEVSHPGCDIVIDPAPQPGMAEIVIGGGAPPDAVDYGPAIGSFVPAEPGRFAVAEVPAPGILMQISDAVRQLRQRAAA